MIVVLLHLESVSYLVSDEPPPLHLAAGIVVGIVVGAGIVAAVAEIVVVAGIAAVVAGIAASPGIVVEAGTPVVVVYLRMQVGWAVVKVEKGICSTVVVEAVGISAEEVEVEIVAVEVEAGMFVGEVEAVGTFAGEVEAGMFVEEVEVGMLVWQVGLAEQVVVGKFA